MWAPSEKDVSMFKRNFFIKKTPLIPQTPPCLAHSTKGLVHVKNEGTGLRLADLGQHAMSWGLPKAP